MLYQDNLAFIPLTFHTMNFVAFKPIYIATDIILSCDYDLINLEMDNWIQNNTNEPIETFTSKWSFTSPLNDNENIVESSNRNIFINPSSLQQPLTDEYITVEFKMTLENLDILNDDTTVTPTITFPLQRSLGQINAIISNGMYQYFPYQMNSETISISLVGNELSFDQEPDTDSSSDWQYLWNCTRYDNNTSCPSEIESYYNEPILEFKSNVLEQDAIYMFYLQITDESNGRTDVSFMYLTVTESVDIIVTLNIDWDKGLHYLPTHYTHIKVVASIDSINDDFGNNNNGNDTSWVYTFCFEPALQNGVSCDSFKTSDGTFTFEIDPFQTLPNHNYVEYILCKFLFCCLLNRFWIYIYIDSGCKHIKFRGKWICINITGNLTIITYQ